MPAVSITGASGFIGQILCRKFLENGWEVIGTTTGRSERSIEGVSMLKWQIHDPPPLELLSANVLVHLSCACIAEPPRRRSASERNSIDVQGTRQLVSAWRGKHRASPFIFMSSMSSSPDAANQYGRIKFLTESILSHRGDFILRPGIVMGNGSGGLYNLLKRGLVASPVFPTIRTPPWLYCTDIDKLSAVVLEIAGGKILASDEATRLDVISSGPMTFEGVLDEICSKNNIARPVLVNVPSFVLRVFDALSLIGGPLFFLRERLYGLFPPDAKRTVKL